MHKSYHVDFSHTGYRSMPSILKHGRHTPSPSQQQVSADKKTRGKFPLDESFTRSSTTNHDNRRVTHQVVSSGLILCINQSINCIIFLYQNMLDHASDWLVHRSPPHTESLAMIGPRQHGQLSGALDTWPQLHARNHLCDWGISNSFWGSVVCSYNNCQFITTTHTLRKFATGCSWWETGAVSSMVHESMTDTRGCCELGICTGHGKPSSKWPDYVPETPKVGYSFFPSGKPTVVSPRKIKNTRKKKQTTCNKSNKNPTIKKNKKLLDAQKTLANKSKQLATKTIVFENPRVSTTPKTCWHDELSAPLSPMLLLHRNLGSLRIGNHETGRHNDGYGRSSTMSGYNNHSG